MVKLHKEIRPHSTNQELLRKSSSIYKKGKTPEIDTLGRLTELNVKPCGPDIAAKHLQEIRCSFGDAGVQKTINGLQITRGNQFVLRMMEIDPGLRNLSPNARSNEAKPTIPAPVRLVLGSHEPGTALQSHVRALFKEEVGEDPKDIRTYSNTTSYEAAASIGARAFTVGNRIFFGKGQYDPQSDSGKELLVHEITHAYQQKRASMPSVESLRISSPYDQQERQADRLAHSIVKSSRNKAGNDDGGMLEDQVAAHEVGQVNRVNVARIQRAISFTTAAGAFTTNPMVADETAAGFMLKSAAEPTFQWQPDVTIHGNAGDPFADWEVAHHQVGKSYWNNIYWGTGANRTHRRWRIDGGLPMRDVAQTAANTWYSDFRAQGFTAAGDVRSPIMRDSPHSAREPWDNPIAGRVGNRGWFNYGFGFVSTLSARHIPTGTGAAAFRHLNHVHWNFGIAGTFDRSQPLGSRVTITEGGPINHSRVFSGYDPAFPPMHGGDVINDHFVHTDT